MKQWYSAALGKIQTFLKPPPKEEELQLHDVVIFYNFVFDIGKPVDPTQAARKLLEKDFACASANLISNTIEVAPRLKRLHNIRELAVQLAVVSSYIQLHKWKAVFSWVLHHPNYTFFLLRSARGRKANKHATTNASRQQKSMDAVLTDTLKFIDHSMAKFQSIEALHLYSDRRLFSPLYLREAPFTRVGLQPFFATIDGEDIGVDVSLVIHRTGVAILTCGVMFKTPKTVDTLIHLKVIEQIQIPHFEVAKALVDVPSTAHGLARMRITPTKKRYSSGVEWCKYEDQKPVNLLFILQLYQIAVTAAIIGKTPRGLDEPFSWLRTTDWIAYPIMFVRQVTPQCSTDEEFKKRHAQELAGLVLGFPQWKQIKPDRTQEVVTKDLTLTSNYSLYLETSHTTVIYYADHLARLERQFGKDIPGQEWLFHHFQTSAIVEALLIQEWILHIHDCELNMLPYNLTKLNRLKQNLILALDEYHKILFSDGTAQNILKGGQEVMGVHDRHEGIVQKLDRVEKLIEVGESQQLARRNLFFNFVLLLLTLIAGLPSAQQIVTVVNSWNIIHFNTVLAVSTLYISFVALVLISVIWQLMPTRRRKLIVPFDQSQTAMKKHFTWPQEMKFTSTIQKTVNRSGNGKNTLSK